MRKNTDRDDVDRLALIVVVGVLTVTSVKMVWVASPEWQALVVAVLAVAWAEVVNG